jgi:putative addiction module killer protein
MIRVESYIDSTGRRPFDTWRDGLNARARAKVEAHIARLELGNLSEIKTVGGGVLERRIDFGPGYRIYFGREGQALIILLGGGSKRGQRRDIEAAQALWREYQARKQKPE